MDYSMINKIDKARQYAEDPKRFTVKQFVVDFHGSHRDHRIAYEGDAFQCDCEYFGTHSTCSHTMAVERVLGEILTE